MTDPPFMEGWGTTQCWPRGFRLTASGRPASKGGGRMPALRKGHPEKQFASDCVSFFVCGVEDFLGGAEGIHGRRHAGVDAGLQKDFCDLLARDAVIEGAANVQLDFMGAV